MRTEIVTSLKRSATKILADLQQTHEPVLITEHGRPSAYLVAADDFEMMQARMKILEGIALGERALLEKRTFTKAQAKAALQKWLD